MLNRQLRIVRIVTQISLRHLYMSYLHFNFLLKTISILRCHIVPMYYLGVGGTKNLLEDVKIKALRISKKN